MVYHIPFAPHTVWETTGLPHTQCSPYHMVDAFPPLGLGLGTQENFFPTHTGAKQKPWLVLHFRFTASVQEHLQREQLGRGGGQS